MSSRRARVNIKKSPVTRAQAVADFGRKKARQRRRQFKRRAVTLGGIAMLFYIAGGGWWMLHTGNLQQVIEHSSAALWNQTAKFGFRVEQITLVGRHHADAAEVKAALGIEKGSPILAVSLTDMQRRLQKIAEIDTVRISRLLPDHLLIAISERTPVAWWQKRGVQQLIDVHGVVLSRAKYPGKLILPVVVGEDAPAHIAQLVSLLAMAPSIRPDVVAAVRVGQRRWNIQLAHEVVVMLPETNPVAAWKRFAALVEKEALLSRAIRSVDMRMEDRVFITPIEQDRRLITISVARDT